MDSVFRPSALALAALLTAACSQAAPQATRADGPTGALSSPVTAVPAGPSTTPAPTAVATTAAATKAPTAAPTAQSRALAPVVVVVQSALQVPWDVAFAPDGRMFVTERRGNLIVFAGGAPGAARLSSTAIPLVAASGEAGLMGIALDPSFATNAYAYVCATRNDGGLQNQILRLRIVGDVPHVDAVLLKGIRAGGNHDGCRLRFGPDGKLWATMGDAGVSSLAQDPSSLNGKVLRINADGTIPADNPILPGASTRSAAYSMGHRNPQGIDFEPGTGAVFEVEHGENDDDEINLLRPGANYGWPIVRQSGGAARGMVDPLWSSGTVTYAVSGGAFVSGTAWGAWSGSLFVATLKDTTLRRFIVGGGAITAAEILYRGAYGRLRAVVLGPDGALYVTTSNRDGRGAPAAADDRILRLAPTP